MKERQDKTDPTKPNRARISRMTRRSALKTTALAGAGLTGGLASGAVMHSAYAQGSDAPIRVGFQVHRTGIGAVYGRWYERTATAAAKHINDAGGIAGRPVELVPEDDGTDPKRGGGGREARGSAQGGLRLRTTVLARGHRLARARGRAEDPLLRGERGLPRGIGQAEPVRVPAWDHRRARPGLSHGPLDNEQSGEKGHDDLSRLRVRLRPSGLLQRRAQGSGRQHRSAPGDPAHGVVIHPVLPAHPGRHRGALSRHGGTGGAYLRKELGEHFGAKRPEIFGFIDSLEGVDFASPGLEYLEGTHFWEAMPRYESGYPTPHAKNYRKHAGINANGASVKDPKDVSTNSHMFGCWETLYVIKEAVEQSGYRSKKDYPALIETLEGFQWFNEGAGHPQGGKKFVGQIHQCFGQQFISKVKGSKLEVVHRTSIEDGLYEPEADYTKKSL